MIEETTDITRCYTIKGTKEKLLGDAMKENKKEHIPRKRLGKTSSIENDTPKEQAVNVEESLEIDWSESESEEGDLDKGPEMVKVLTIQERMSNIIKRSESASTREAGS